MQRLLADSVRFASYRFPYVIDSVMVNSPAAQAGIQAGDSIIALNGTPISFSDFKEAMAERKKNEATLLKDSIDPRLITLTYVRNGATDTLSMRVDSAYPMDAMGYCLYGASALICPMLDARRQQVYTGLYRYEEKFEIVKEQYITDIHTLIAELNERGERVIFLGDGVPVNRAVIEEEMKVPYSFAPAQASRQRASAVAALGAVYLAEGKTETAAEHKPDYLRKSQAEREREVAERQGEMDKLAAGIVVVEKK